MALNLFFHLICLLTLFRCVTSMYRNYSLERKEICPLQLSMPEVRVGKENFSSVIVHDGNYFKRWRDNVGFDCKFHIRASFGLSLMAVIQSMNLRKNTTTDECIDYIQFGYPKDKYIFGVNLDLEQWTNLDIHKDKWDGRKICGELTNQYKSGTASLIDYSTRNKKGNIYVHIHVDRKPLAQNSSIRLEIIFTSYKECRYNEGVYKMCGESTCIHKNYFNDLVINCPGCEDELSCYPKNEGGGDPELNTKVTVTAVTSIFLSFFLFLGCMMLCRYFLLFRQWHQPPPVTTVEMTPPPPDENLCEPSAPPPAQDKDLPPAYETLFPDR